MKKLCLSILVFFSAFCFGSDIIVTKSSEKIEGSIVEVSKTEIKYRKANNPTGPVFVISKEDIATIIYSNGDVEAFADAAPAQNNNVQNNMYSQANNYQENNQSGMAAKSGELITQLSSNSYMYDGRPMNNQQLGTFLQYNCQPAYEQWRKGVNYQNYGITWAVLGPVLCLPVGLTLYACCYSYSSSSKKYYINSGMYGSGIFFMTFGAAMTVVSIPFLAIGTKNKNNAYMTYNNSCAKGNSRMSLNFNVNTDGAGLALKF